MSFGEIKYAVNSTLGKEYFESLDNIVKGTAPTFAHTTVFIKDGTFNVPDGVTKIYVTACAGGGSGAYGSLTGIAGTATIVGDLVTLLPGQGGRYGSSYSSAYGGAAGGPGGGNGGGGMRPMPDGLPGISSFGGRGANNTGGGGGSLGGGGAGWETGVTQVLAGTSFFHDGVVTCGSFGGGGGGVFYNSSSYNAGGGGGDAIIGKAYDVTPGQTIAITVGKGGNWGTSQYRDRCMGGDGIVIIEW